MVGAPLTLIVSVNSPPPSVFASDIEFPRFRDVAPAAGLAPNELSGGSVVDDFDGDNLLDLMITSIGLRDQMRFYRNNGDGTFKERTREAGLLGLVGGLNLVAADFIATVVEEDLSIEDRLNDEVRELLSQYSDYMRREGVSYQDMFRRIKNTLITQRKVIRASGRDTGDAMKLSRDKINDISHKVVAALRKSRDFRLKRDPNDVRLELVKVMTEILQTED